MLQQIIIMNKVLMNQFWLEINDYNNHCLINISHILLISEPTNNNHAVTKAYVDSLSENDRNRRDLSKVHNDQDNELENNNFR